MAFMAALAAGQEPSARPQPQIRTGIRTLQPATRQQPHARPARATRAPGYRALSARGQAQQSMQSGQIPSQPGAPPQMATPNPTPAPTPASLQPVRPSDMPPVPPQVTYRDGMLTVQALNSTLGSLLQAIRNKTGIQFEGAENSGERVAIAAGPAPEAEVLASIFSGSGFDYVVIGRSDDPSIVQRVILTQRARGGGVPGSVAAQQQMQQPRAQQQTDEEVPDEQADVEPQDTPAQPPQFTPPPTAQEQPKTPEQLLQELKELQQRQQGQQPQPNQVPIKPPPR